VIGIILANPLERKTLAERAKDKNVLCGYDAGVLDFILLNPSEAKYYCVKCLVRRFFEDVIDD